MNTTFDLSGISRIEQKRRVRPGGASGPYSAWWVRMEWVRTEEGKKYPRIQRAFPDGEHGGPDLALEAAIAFRDEQMRTAR